MTQLMPFDWVREALPELVDLDEVPLLGYNQTFSWEEFSKVLSQVLSCEKIDIEVAAPEWRQSETYFEKIPDTHYLLQFFPSGYEGTVWLATAKSDVVQLMAAILNLEGDISRMYRLDDAYLKGFYYFMGLQILSALSAIKFDKNICYTLTECDSITEERALCIDLSTTVKEKKTFSRLLISTEFRKAWAARYPSEPQKLLINTSLAQKIKISVHIEAGYAVLTQKEWKKIKSGDVLILDHSLIHTNLTKIKVLLTVKGKTYFRARLKKGSLKILEFPLIHHTGEQMSYDDDDNEIEMDYSDADHDDDESLEEASSPTPSDQALPASKEPSLVSASDIPLKIVVELGRVQMSVQQLVSLQPGNIVELDIDPEQGVDLVVNGAKIARGELLKLGDHFGVRILECGN